MSRIISAQWHPPKRLLTPRSALAIAPRPSPLQPLHRSALLGPQFRHSTTIKQYKAGFINVGENESLLYFDSMKHLFRSR